jgi:hypothetical protein
MALDNKARAEDEGLRARRPDFRGIRPGAPDAGAQARPRGAILEGSPSEVIDHSREGLGRSEVPCLGDAELIVLARRQVIEDHALLSSGMT